MCDNRWCTISTPCPPRRERQRLFSARWHMAYNAARVRAIEAGAKPGVAMEVKR